MMPEIPEFPFRITLIGGRNVYVWEETTAEEEWMPKGARTFSTTDLRCWTHNGETICLDVLLTLIAGAVLVEHVSREA